MNGLNNKITWSWIYMASEAQAEAVFLISIAYYSSFTSYLNIRYYLHLVIKRYLILVEINNIPFRNYRVTRGSLASLSTHSKSHNSSANVINIYIMTSSWPRNHTPTPHGNLALLGSLSAPGKINSQCHNSICPSLWVLKTIFIRIT